MLLQNHRTIFLKSVFRVGIDLIRYNSRRYCIRIFSNFFSSIFFLFNYLRILLLIHCNHEETFQISGSGAGHADELPYLFYPKILLPNLTEFGEPETTVIKNMCSLWTNFVKTRSVDYTHQMSFLQFHHN